MTESDSTNKKNSPDRSCCCQSSERPRPPLAFCCPAWPPLATAAAVKKYGGTWEGVEKWPEALLLLLPPLCGLVTGEGWDWYLKGTLSEVVLWPPPVLTGEREPLRPGDWKPSRPLPHGELGLALFLRADCGVECMLSAKRSLNLGFLLKADERQAYLISSLRYLPSRLLNAWRYVFPFLASANVFPCFRQDVATLLRMSSAGWLVARPLPSLFDGGFGLRGMDECSMNFTAVARSCDAC